MDECYSFLLKEAELCGAAHRVLLKLEREIVAEIGKANKFLLVWLGRVDNTIQIDDNESALIFCGMNLITNLI